MRGDREGRGFTKRRKRGMRSVLRDDGSPPRALDRTCPCVLDRACLHFSTCALDRACLYCSIARWIGVSPLSHVRAGSGVSRVLDRTCLHRSTCALDRACLRFSMSALNQACLHLSTCALDRTSPLFHARWIGNRMGGVGWMGEMVGRG